MNSGMLRDAVICEPVRSPIGRFGGALKPLTAADLALAVLRGLLARTGLNGEHIDEVIIGQANPTNEAPAIGRVLALDAELGDGVVGMQLDRRCGSGLQAVIQAAMQVQVGASELVIAGGVEHMSSTPFYSLDHRWGSRSGDTTMIDALGRPRVTAGGRLHPIPGGMIETAENLRADFAISREAQDDLSLESHRRAVAAQDAGIFAEEIIAVGVPSRSGEQLVELDEHPRRELTAEALARLRPIMGASLDGATVTAGNSSGQNDAAAMCVVTHPQRAAELGLRPLVRLVSWATAGVSPERMGIGPVPATALALERAGLTLAEVDLIELNEAFAAQALAVTTSWGLGADDMERVNVHGSGISLGHPIGATGVRMLSALARELERRDGRFGLETMCIGGGQGIAAIFENVATSPV